MKKIFSVISIVLIAVTALSLFTSCGGEKLTLDKLINEQGFSQSYSTYSDEAYYAVFTKESSLDKIYLVIAPLTAEAHETVSTLEFDDPDYKTKYNEFLLSLNDVLIEDVTSFVPAKDAYTAFSGKTLGELEDAGYKRSSGIAFENSYLIVYGFNGFWYHADITEGVDPEVKPDDLSDDARRALKIDAFDLNNVPFDFFNAAESDIGKKVSEVEKKLATPVKVSVFDFLKEKAQIG